MILMGVLIAAIGLESGSAAVVIRTREQVVVAADSKSVRSDDRNIATTICKINVFGNVLTVSTGLQREASLDYDITKLIRNAAMAPGPLEQKMNQLDAAAVPELERIMNWARTMEPEWFHRHYELQGELLVQVAFVTATGKPSGVAIRSYRARSEPERVKVLAEKVALQMGSIAFLGEDEAMYELARSEGVRIVNNPVEGARRLIQSAIRGKPSLVGPPVRIIRVRAGVIDWVEGRDGC